MSLADLVTIGIAVVIILVFQWFLNYTFLGRSMEATAQNPDVARILGINVDRMILYTFLINAVLVTVGALLITPSYFAKFSNGEALGLWHLWRRLLGGLIRCEAR